jgi:hypothetical protein
MTSSLSLKKDVDVIVNLSPRALPRNGFNIGAIIGKTEIITTTQRVKAYGEADEMLEDGFALTDPLYLGAVEYFKQQDNLGASLSELYIIAVGKKTVEGQQVDETYVEALNDARAKASEWYGFTNCEDLTDAELEAVADASELLDATVFLGVTHSSTAKTDNASNVIKKICDKNYKRSIVTWHENQYFGCGLLGYAMGANTGLINSAYTLKYKQIIGQVASALTTDDVNVIEKYYGNCYVTRAKAQYEQGTCANGTWFDEIINLDKLVNDIQLNVYDLLYSVPKEPQTEAGHNDIAGVISQACEQARKIGFIGENLKWRRTSILALQKGDVLPTGYLIQWEDVNEQSDADRDARKSQPFYVCINLAGAIHSVVIQVNVSR